MGAAEEVLTAPDPPDLREAEDGEARKGVVQDVLSEIPQMDEDLQSMCC